MLWLYDRSVADDLSSVPIAPPLPLEKDMLDRLRHECARIGAIRSRMKELASCYNEYLDLREEETSRRQRAERIVAVIGPYDFESYSLAAQEPARAYLSKSPEELRSGLPLWEAMREYLSYVPEARIGEMEEFFQRAGLAEGNRQAIESALKRHPKVFSTRKKKREKYIALRR